MRRSALALALLLPASCRTAPERPRDGRLPLGELHGRFRSLEGQWRRDTVFGYPGGGLAIEAFRTAREGKALWLIAGIHGEEPAGPNALARSLSRLEALEAAGIPVVLLPLCNPKGYQNGWRYPNTAERDWRKGGYSVGDAEYLLPDLKGGDSPRAAAPAGAETAALTAYALRLARAYPPALVIDLHEDELSREGGYVYSQGSSSGASAAAAEIIRLLQASGIPLRLTGSTRFGEPIQGGIVSVDERGEPLRDGSIDELLGSARVFEGGRLVAGPNAPAVFVVETPAFAGSNLEQRVAAHAAVLERLDALWELSRR